MKKLLIATVLVAAFATPALAEEFFIMYEMASKKCVTMKSMPSDMKGYKMLGKYRRSARPRPPCTP
jgi:hypothetical protein